MRCEPGRPGGGVEEEREGAADGDGGHGRRGAGGACEGADADLRRRRSGRLRGGAAEGCRTAGARQGGGAPPGGATQARRGGGAGAVGAGDAAAGARGRVGAAEARERPRVGEDKTRHLHPRQLTAAPPPPPLRLQLLSAFSALPCWGARSHSFPHAPRPKGTVHSLRPLQPAFPAPPFLPPAVRLQSQTPCAGAIEAH